MDPEGPAGPLQHAVPDKQDRALAILLAGWKTKSISPEKVCSSRFSALAAPSRAAVWASWPQACITPGHWEA